MIKSDFIIPLIGYLMVKLIKEISEKSVEKWKDLRAVGARTAGDIHS